MDNRIYHIKISPEVIQNKIFTVFYDNGPFIPPEIIDECCDVTTTTTTGRLTAFTTVYSSMTQILSGGTNGTSILTGMTIPIFLTENTVDMGFYSVFDGFAEQKDVFTNFLFSATTGSPFTYYFYNTSQKDFYQFLSFADYVVDWGDNTPQQVATNLTPNFYSHTYSTPGEYTISFSGLNPWGSTVVKKTVYVPFTGVTIPNPNGTAYFTPQGGSWSGTALSLDYIFQGDANCDIGLNIGTAYTATPFLITGYTNSNVKDLRVYGKKLSLINGEYIAGVQVTGNSDTIGTYWGPSADGSYTAYTINNIDYYDFSGGTTIFVVQTSGLTTDWLICSAITKEEMYINMSEEPQVQSNLIVDRGKNSGLESLQRLGEIDNVGDIEKYGYSFFTIINVGE